MPEAPCNGPPLFRSGRVALLSSLQGDVSSCRESRITIFFNDVVKHTA